MKRKGSKDSALARMGTTPRVVLVRGNSRRGRKRKRKSVLWDEIGRPGPKRRGLLHLMWGRGGGVRRGGGGVTQKRTKEEEGGQILRRGDGPISRGK